MPAWLMLSNETGLPLIKPATIARDSTDNAVHLNIEN
jgi:hypothetical protein